MNPVIIGNATLYLGDALAVLAALPAESVHCCVTSPPYWGLRDYGTAKWEGGDAECDHLGKPMPTRAGFNERYFERESTEGNKQDALREPQGKECKKCGAKRTDAQLGLESTPAEYVEKMVAVFREVRRVLRDDGTLWLNLGDSYASSPAGNFGPNMPAPADGGRYRENKPKMDYKLAGIKPKDLVGIPWRVAFALQADGWYLRQDIIWAKPNPMPESVRDRCTKAHEYLFLLAKSERYYFDAAAIAEPYAETSISRMASPVGSSACKDWGKDAAVAGGGASLNNGRTHTPNEQGRNKRSVWTVTTQPFKEAHFATFPPKLIEPCILAGCPAGGTVLDPFNGSGTTGLVSLEHGRHYIGIELNPEYLELTMPRIENAQRQGRLIA